jgi:lysine biosynthesis protein LysW
MALAECPSCGESVNVGTRPKMGQRVVCQACDTELEVVWLDPVELDWPFDVEDDEEYFYDDDYEEDY